ncbi:hypothetical protein AGOR_G00229990 [Albula goreensis]|uniref:Fibronectin type-III domain-containing protein n=1 Tax=Albula goreensis TaxID=1534307 RepID=A0A8T3CJX6_9TELE|nr:hypothetical protein AGOR_G00229990 [Albula goreensis]
MAVFSHALSVVGVQRAAFFSLSFLFCGLIRHDAFGCNVTCTTDYISMLNCSCSGLQPMTSYRVEAECWDEMERVNGNCIVRPPQRWCQMEPGDFDYLVSIGTNCTAKATAISGDQNVAPVLTHMKLHQVVKPRPPFNINLTENNGSFTISWEMVYTEDENFYLNGYLMYRVRIRTEEETQEDPLVFVIEEDRRFFVIPDVILKEGKGYMVDVQATIRPKKFKAHWSEWSPTIKWKIKSKSLLPLNLDTVSDGEDSTATEIYLFLLAAVLPCAVLFYFGRIGRLKNLHPWGYTSSPESFFKPLYQTYQGDFKKWVGPAFTFSEFDFLEKNMPVQVVYEKQAAGLEGLHEGAGEDGDGRDSRGSRGVDGSSGVSPYPDGALEDINQGNPHSTGHISIDTVTVSGGDSTGLGGSGNPYRGDFLTYPGGGQGQGPQFKPESSFNAERASGHGRAAREAHVVPPVAPGPYRMEWQLVPRDNELEQISLDSFCSTEHSEDGYPRVGLDLDTMDSGFLESDCSSPVSSDFDGTEPMSAAILCGAGNLNTNYVKQWMAYTSATQGNSTS